MTVKPLCRKGLPAIGLCVACGLFVLGFQKEFQEKRQFSENALPQAAASPLATPTSTPALSSSPTSSSFKLRDLLDILGILAAIWGVYQHIISRREKKRAESEKIRAEQAEASLQRIGEELKERIGYQIGKLEIKVFITNYDGNCHSRWTWTDISKVRPDTALSRIPGRIRFSTPGCLFSKYPTLSSGYDRRYEIEFIRKDTNLCEFQVRVKEATNKISYEYISDIDKAFCMSEEDLAEQPYKYEWFGFHISSAIETLTIKVSFPSHYQPDNVQPDACIGMVPTDFSDNSEVERIIKNEGFKNESGDVSVTVSKPKIGYVYFIRWKPLPKKVVNSLKAVKH
jgi:hypothetical protein